jgi:hypothetical protein
MAQQNFQTQDMSQSTQPQLWHTQQDGIESQMGGLFYNLDTEDALPDFHEPNKARALWHPASLACDSLALRTAFVSVNSSLH